MKPIVWIGNTRRRLQKFPQEAREQGGHELWQVQLGFSPSDWRPMPSIGAGVIEIRLHRPHEHRILYVATFEAAVFVIHAFPKKTNKTSQEDIKIAEANYGQIKEEIKKLKKNRKAN